MRPSLSELLASMRVLLVSRTFWFRLAVVAMLSASFFARQAYMERGLPYCHHVDENTWTERSIHMLKTSDLNPHRFTKPSVMVYLNTAGLALGLVRAGAHQGEVYQPKDLNDSGYPFYNSPTAIRTVRTIYSLLSVTAMLLGAWCVRRLSNSRAATLISLVLMEGSGDYFRYSFWYLNVDILGVVFATLAISYAYLRAPKTPPVPAAAIMGVLAGLTVGCKYNLFWIAIPMLVQVLWMSKRLIVERVVLFFACMIGAFLITTPFAVLDVQHFLHEAAYEAHHYAVGHKKRTYDAGLDMFLRNFENLRERFSPLVLAVAVFGLIRAAARDLRGALVVFSYSIALLIYMSSQRTFFPRNVLILSLSIPMMAGLGLVELYQWLRLRLEGRFEKAPSRFLGAGLTAVMSLVVLSTTPWSAVASRWDPQVESRNEAVDWILANVPKGEKVFIAKELNFYDAPIREDYEIITYKSEKSAYEKLKKKHRNGYMLVPTIRQKSRRVRVPKGMRLAEFGEKKVDMKYPEFKKRPFFTASGNPKFSIEKL